ncbi:MAG: Undecaprenyl-phosphate mannosyltransferase [Candidatus Dichloromethanomonas elyunquensis]|nr:MAG: Undecaprenyl-phosphate mannosyltransferase [Candidatus Dichloromethanomonas elyunquensis]
MNVLIALPAYNEEAGIANVLESIIRFRNYSRYSIEVLLVNDGSTDQTSQVVRNFTRKYADIKMIEHNGNKGLGEALKTILRYTIEHMENEDILVTMDADNTHSPLLIESMIGSLISHDLDMVVASRFTDGGCELGLKAIRKLYSRGAMCFFKLFFPIKNLNDYSSGFRAYRVGIIRQAQERWIELITTNGFDCMAEIAARFSRMGIKAGEVPLILNYGLKEGASKMKVAKTVKGYFSLLAKVR